MTLLKQLGDGKNRQDAYRSGQVRYPVKWLIKFQTYQVKALPS
jgi:hypothetical protein